jgi:predicted PurR-regulated permease PerM
MLTSPPWTSRTKRLIAAIVIGVCALAVLRLSEILPIIGVGVILSYLLTPVVNFFSQRVLIYRPLSGRMNRNLAVLLTYVMIIVALIVITLVVVPVLVRQLEEFGRLLPELFRSLEQSIEHSLNEPLTFNGEPILLDGQPFIPLEQLRLATGVEHITELFQLGDLNLVQTTQSFISSLTGPAFNFVGGALTALINIIFLLSMMFFLMRDGAVFIDRSVQLIPVLYRGDVRRLLYELGRVWNAYLRGQVSLAFLMGGLAFAAATILGLPNPAILGLISFLLEFIPGIGSGLAIFPAALLALTSRSSTFSFLEGAPFALVTAIVWAALQNLEAYILIPRIMGGSLNLHPFVVIVAIIAGATLAGLLGIILAAPAVASLRVFGQYIYGKLMDRDPFPATPVPKSQARLLWLRRQVAALQQEWNDRWIPAVRQWIDARRKQDV